VKSRSQYEIALVHLRFEPDTEAMIVKSIVPAENCLARVKAPIEGLLGVLAGIILQFKGIGRFFDGQAPFIFTGVGDDIPYAGKSIAE
jgi:hypothetical protein